MNVVIDNQLFKRTLLLHYPLSAPIEEVRRVYRLIANEGIHPDIAIASSFYEIVGKGFRVEYVNEEFICDLGAGG